MDNSVERDKRIEEIEELLEFNTIWWNAACEGELMSQDEIEIVRDLNADVKWLISELSRLQVERDKAIAGLKALADTISPGRGVLYTDKLPKYQYARKVLSELGVPHDPLD